jgi:hypothetical protein
MLSGRKRVQIDSFSSVWQRISVQNQLPGSARSAPDRKPLCGRVATGARGTASDSRGTARPEPDEHLRLTAEAGGLVLGAVVLVRTGGFLAFNDLRTDQRGNLHLGQGVTVYLGGPQSDWALLDRAGAGAVHADLDRLGVANSGERRPHDVRGLAVPRLQRVGQRFAEPISDHGPKVPSVTSATETNKGPAHSHHSSQTGEVGWEELAAGHPVIVLEGCDGTGKSTLATLLGTQYGYTIIRSGRLPDGADLAERYREALDQPGNLVLDRSFITELVYGPLRAGGRSRLTPDESAELAFALADRGGVAVHLTAHPKALAWRLRQRDGHAPPLEWLRSVVRSYRNVFAALDGATPIVRIDTTAGVT